MKQLAQSKLAILDKKALMVDSAFFSDITYGIDKDGKGMWVLYGDKEIRIAAENVKRLCTDMMQIWKLHGKK